MKVIVMLLSLVYYGSAAQIYMIPEEPFSTMEECVAQVPETLRSLQEAADKGPGTIQIDSVECVVIDESELQR